MRQLPLDIGTQPARTFESFVTGQNAHAVAHLRQVTQQTAPVFLWGTSGVGKTHLLEATANLVQQRGGRVAWFDASEPTPWQVDEGAQLVVIDNCDRLDEARQQAAFAAFIEATTHGIPVVGAGTVPPVDLPVRDDLRTRLGWGHVFAVQPLSEPEARAALRREADRRGLFLSDEVMDYLLTHFARDLKHLMSLLDRLDEFALVHKRAITVPLLKQMLTEEGA
ncbi:DnaA regulatory inactivator Hda [Rhizobacter sp. LjRoot28]|jgi:DnaA family protein|uniref:DnaA regulatory inactivator Hda n=1 Tax=Rhizobacter sp. LjRoot28 TaxID=3342309 RepID=UPI003ECFE30C